MKIPQNLFAILITGTLLLAPLNQVHAREAWCKNERMKSYMSRGEVISKVVRIFDLANKNKAFLSNCNAHLEDCFFVFATMSRFDDISFQPLMLYPDVSPAYAYYEEINLASKLGIIHGYLDEKNSPLHPRKAMERIDALKVILEGAGLIRWKDRFELVLELGNEKAVKHQKTVFKDIDAAQGGTWWHPRYVSAGIDTGIIEETSYFRPHDLISPEEFQAMLNLGLMAK